MPVTVNPQPPVPADLKAATTGLTGENYGYRLSYRYCKELIACGCQDEWTWGYRIYRTAYSRPTADQDFAKAMEVLHERMRDGVWADCDDAREFHGEQDVDETPNEELWKRLKNEVVQDRALLEGASPARLGELHHEFIRSRGLKTHNSARDRFFVIVDDEVIDKLLLLPEPAPTLIHVKVFDAEFGLPDSYFNDSDESDDEIDDELSEEEESSYEGWFWQSCSVLVEMWFSDMQKSLDEMYTFDDEDRPVHLGRFTPIHGLRHIH